LVLTETQDGTLDWLDARSVHDANLLAGEEEGGRSGILGNVAVEIDEERVSAPQGVVDRL
jgi:hypothetical protein